MRSWDEDRLGTDVYFDFIHTEDVCRYCERIREHEIDAVLLGGDIAMSTQG